MPLRGEGEASDNKQNLHRRGNTPPLQRAIRDGSREVSFSSLNPVWELLSQTFSKNHPHVVKYMWTWEEIPLKVNDQRETRAGQSAIMLSHRMQHRPIVGTDKIEQMAHHPLISLWEAQWKFIFSVLAWKVPNRRTIFYKVIHSLFAFKIWKFEQPRNRIAFLL